VRDSPFLGADVAEEFEHVALSAVIFALVLGPTLPTAAMPLALWKADTAAAVRGPK
jgi:hypothetical protein